MESRAQPSSTWQPEPRGERGWAGDTTREAFGAAAPSGDGESGRAGGSIPTPGCPDAAGPSRA